MINEEKRMLKKVVQGLLFSIVPIVLFYMMEAFEHNAFEEVRRLAQVYNIILFELMGWILFFITGNGKTALRIETAAAFLYGLINHYIMAFRSTPFVPWDLFSIKTAVSVAGNYDFTPSKEVVFVSIAFFLLFFLLKFIRFQFESGVLLRIIPVISVSLMLGAFVNQLWDDGFQTKSYLYPFLFTPAHMTKVNGMAVTFAMDMEYLFVEKPEGYSIKKAKEILEAYETSEHAGENETETLPNLIVIMNEAFSDLSVLGEFTTNEDYMPFIHSLQLGEENTITGNLEVSVCGGNTANSEFEFLTGHTMDFFPVGSIPYQQYIDAAMPSLASWLNKLGYETYGMHPYNAGGWQRDEVYPLLGFKNTCFLDDFSNRHYIRNYVSDQTAYEKIIQIYEKKQDAVPLFAFEVTMQNHSGYTEAYENFSPDIHVAEAESFALDQYLSLMKVSDEAFAELVNYFSKEEEKTILVFFGDHQPNDSIANKITGLNRGNGSELSVEEAKLRYQVPYVIWANFDIEEKTGADTDISFLGAELMKIAGIEMTPYQRFLLDVKNNPDSEEYLEKYQILQYYYTFDYEEE